MRRILAVVILTAMTLTGCAVGPDTGPEVVQGGGAGGGAASPSAKPAPALPSLQAPKSDLAWSDCGRQTAAGFGVPAPAGVTVECARMSVPVDKDQPQGDTLTVGLTRARTPGTPKNAVPLVLTSGSDLPSSRELLTLAGSAGRSLLDKHPVVAIDRRGTSSPGALDCMTRAERDTMRSNGMAGPPPASQNDRIDRLAHAASTAADGCADTLRPHQLAFSATNAADDIEALRKKWGVDHLALWGVGEGSDVVLDYTAGYAGRAGRIILDTPTAFGAPGRDRASGRATGVQAALRTFAQQCSGAGPCPLGPDGMATIGNVLTMGRTGRLGGLSDTEALAGITTALATGGGAPQDLSALAATIAAAAHGDTAGLRGLADQAAALRTTDGQLVSRCNDLNGQIGQNELPGLIDAWGKQNPLTGADTALSLMRCNAWPSVSPTHPPNQFPVGPLVLSGSNDPLGDGPGAAALGAMFIKAGTSPTTVTWDGLGHSVLAHSSCAADVVTQYLGDHPLGDPAERGCPT